MMARKKPVKNPRPRVDCVRCSRNFAITTTVERPEGRVCHSCFNQVTYAKVHTYKYLCSRCRTLFKSPDDDLQDRRCQRCIATLTAVNAPDAKVRPKTERARLRTYGMTEQEYDDMMVSQKFVCAICGRSAEGVRALLIDHNHGTGKVRGLLCRRCNTALGLFTDDPDVMEKAVAYLRERGDYAGLYRQKFLGTRAGDVDVGVCVDSPPSS